MTRYMLDTNIISDLIRLDANREEPSRFAKTAEVPPADWSYLHPG